MLHCLDVVTCLKCLLYCRQAQVGDKIFPSSKSVSVPRIVCCGCQLLGNTHIILAGYSSCLQLSIIDPPAFLFHCNKFMVFCRLVGVVNSVKIASKTSGYWSSANNMESFDCVNCGSVLMDRSSCRICLASKSAMILVVGDLLSALLNGSDYLRFLMYVVTYIREVKLT